MAACRDVDETCDDLPRVALGRRFLLPSLARERMGFRAVPCAAAAVVVGLLVVGGLVVIDRNPGGALVRSFRALIPL